MPEKNNEFEDDCTWKTIGGKRLCIPKGEEGEEYIRQQLPSARGDKESGTKQARKAFLERHNIVKSQFRFRDEVLFDQFTKSGIVYGYGLGDNLKIYSKGRHVERHPDKVFKKSEMIGDSHWDAMTIRDRIDILKASGVSENYLKHDWAKIPAPIQDKIIKGSHPAGYGASSGFSTVTEGVYNPVNQDKTVEEKVKETKTRDEKTKKRDEDSEKRDD
ncbi:MAG: hypothetical protein GWN01_01380 [Nitrosopumilaceae archaeon]|nr:hypothetical protein [Nitrosopumilaceae archaeon]NIU86011.1 hypothetical protein [Nitrosopumilaceae archaeon]NIX60230.1 hypothetical protein [Nitrosopumilaceae archaeon]